MKRRWFLALIPFYLVELVSNAFGASMTEAQARSRAKALWGDNAFVRSTWRGWTRYTRKEVGMRNNQGQFVVAGSSDAGSWSQCFNFKSTRTPIR